MNNFYPGQLHFTPYAPPYTPVAHVDKNKGHVWGAMEKFILSGRYGKYIPEGVNATMIWVIWFNFSHFNAVSKLCATTTISNVLPNQGPK